VESASERPKRERQAKKNPSKTLTLGGGGWRRRLPRLLLLLPPLLSSFTSPLSSLLQATSTTSLPHRRLCTAPHLDDLDQRLTTSPPPLYQRLTSTTSTDASPLPLYSTSPHHDDLNRHLCTTPPRLPSSQTYH
jgi:hypothetical protein